MPGVSVDELLEREWLFVGGMPRTGTALCQHLLNLHPDCHIIGEVSFEVCLLKAFRPGITPNQVTAVFRNTIGEVARYPWGMSRIWEDPEEDDALDWVRRMMAGARSRYPDALVWGARNNIYGHHWEQLRKLFPNCKIIVMDRDVEEVVESILACDWWLEDPCPPETQADEREVWFTRRRHSTRGAVLQVRELMRPCPGAKWVQLAELNASPREVITDLLSWVGLRADTYPWDVAMARFVEGARIN